MRTVIFSLLLVIMSSTNLPETYFVYHSDPNKSLKEE
nr:MAG TPA: hypothetical protein [Caudoviricetes sp.]